MPDNNDPQSQLSGSVEDSLKRRKLEAETKLAEKELEAYGKAPEDAPAAESLWSKLGLAVLTAVLSGLVAFITLQYTNKEDREKWERETTYSAKQTMLNKRIELMDRTVTAVNSFHYVQLIKLSADSELKKEEFVIREEALRSRQRKKAGLPLEQFPNSDAIFDRFVAEQKELNTFQANWASLLTLDSMYFGDQTRKIVRLFPKDRYSYDQTYDPDGAKVRALLDAMDSELNKYPET